MREPSRVAESRIDTGPWRGEREGHVASMRAIICGAGIAGLSLATCLDSAGADVVLLEKSPRLRAQGYMIDFFGPGYDAAEAMELLPRIRELSHDVDELSYCDENGRHRAGIRYSQFARALGGRLLSLMRPDLERALYESLSENVDVRFGTSIEQVVNGPDKVSVGLTDGGELGADVLVGCDGIHSQVRRLVFGAEREYLRYLGLHTAAYCFDDPEVRAGIGNRFCMTDSVRRAMGFYGLTDQRVAVFAVHHADDPTLPGDARAALRREYASLGWMVPSALAACPPSREVYYDQVAQIEMPQWSRNRVVLVGDSCAAVSLLAGQGASLAVAGAYLLARELVQRGTTDVALDHYERALRLPVARTQGSARRAMRWFIPRNGIEAHTRRVALSLGRLPIVERYLARVMVGRPDSIPER